MYNLDYHISRKRKNILAKNIYEAPELPPRQPHLRIPVHLSGTWPNRQHLEHTWCGNTQSEPFLNVHDEKAQGQKQPRQKTVRLKKKSTLKGKYLHLTADDLSRRSPSDRRTGHLHSKRLCSDRIAGDKYSQRFPRDTRTGTVYRTFTNQRRRDMCESVDSYVLPNSCFQPPGIYPIVDCDRYVDLQSQRSTMESNNDYPSSVHGNTSSDSSDDLYSIHKDTKRNLDDAQHHDHLRQLWVKGRCRHISDPQTNPQGYTPLMTRKCSSTTSSTSPEVSEIMGYQGDVSSAGFDFEMIVMQLQTISNTPTKELIFSNQKLIDKDLKVLTSRNSSEIQGVFDPVYDNLRLISWGNTLTNTEDNNTTQQGDPTTQQGESTTQKRDSTTEQGYSTTEPGDSTIELGESTTEQGDSNTQQGDSITLQGDSTTHQGDSTTQVESTTYQCDPTTQGESTTQQVESNTQQSISATNHAESTTQPETSHKQPSDSTTHQEDSTTQQGDSTSKQGDSTRQQGNSTTKQGDSTTQQGDSTTQQGDSITQQEDSTTHQGDSTTKQEDSSTQQGESNTLQGDPVTVEYPVIAHKPSTDKCIRVHDYDLELDIFKTPPAICGVMAETHVHRENLYALAVVTANSDNTHIPVVDNHHDTTTHTLHEHHGSVWHIIDEWEI